MIYGLGLIVSEILAEADVSKDHPDYGAQYNLLHASLSEFGVRAGLDQKIVLVLKRRYPERFTDAAVQQDKLEFAGVIAEIFTRRVAVSGLTQAIDTE
jgi:hypothetical protein